MENTEIKKIQHVAYRWRQGEKFDVANELDTILSLSSTKEEISDEEIKQEALIEYPDPTDIRFLAEAQLKRRKFTHGAHWMRSKLKSQWISVEERLPELKQVVIIYWEYEGVKKITSGSYNPAYKYWQHGNATELKVTHWQHLPESPKI